MALVKPKRATSTRRKAADAVTVSTDLRSTDAGTRREAIRSAVDTGSGKTLLAEALEAETSNANLDLIFAEALRLDMADTLDLLLPYLAHRDAARRNKATEALQSIGAPAAEAMLSALRNPDTDVRIMVLAAVPFLERDVALDLLTQLVAEEREENVLACAVEAFVELDDARALPLLQSLKSRTDLPPSIEFAIGFATERLVENSAD